MIYRREGSTQGDKYCRVCVCIGTGNWSQESKTRKDFEGRMCQCCEREEIFITGGFSGLAQEYSFLLDLMLFFSGFK